MFERAHSLSALPPRNLCELLLRDVSSLLITSHLISRAVKSLRSADCSFSPELMDTLDSIISASEAGERLLHSPLSDSGAVLLHTPDTCESALLTDFLIRLPARVTPGVLGAEVTAKLRLLAQHVELKARLAAEQALLVGQNALCQALMQWATKWRSCGQTLRYATMRAHAQAYIADLADAPVPQVA